MKWEKSLMNKKIVLILDLLMIVLGMLGIVVNDYLSLFFPTTSYPALIILGLIGFVFYYCFSYSYQRSQKLFLMIWLCLTFCLVFLFSTQLRLFLEMLQNVIQYDYFLRFDELLGETVLQYDLFMMLILLWIGIPIVYLIVSLVCCQKHALLKMIVLILCFLFPAFIRHEMAMTMSYCFLVFIIYQFIFSWAVSHSLPNVLWRIIVLSALCLMIVFSSVFLESNPLFQQAPSSIFHQIATLAQGQGVQVIETPYVLGMSSDIDGSLPTGDIHFNHSVALKVQAEKPFSAYLRAYSLANYEDNEWHGVQSEYDNSPSLHMYGQFLNMNYQCESQKVKIIPQKTYDFQFVPYYLQDTYQSFETVYDSYIERQDQDIDVFYHVGKNKNEDEEPYFVVNNFYSEYVYNEYLNVPSDLQELLYALLEEQSEFADDMSDWDIEESVAFVQQLLSQNAQYDLSAGDLPDGQDFVSYFLFENHKGSCTHFSTAGALLLRAMGYPTRFVRGYVMKESDFHQGEATIRQYRSHAWIEVYDQSKGWIPYEMTPTQGEQNAQSVSTLLDQQAQQGETSVSSSSQESQEPLETSTQEQEEQISSPTKESSFLQAYGYYLVLLTGAIISITAYRLLTRHWLHILTRKMTLNQKVIYYDKLIKRLTHHQWVVQQDIQQLVDKARYSQHALSLQEWQMMEKYYQSFIKQFYQSQKWYQKLILKYIKGYL